MFKKYKNKIIISSLVIIGVLLLLISSFDFSKKDEKDTSSYLYTEALEKKIEEFLKKVDGIYEAKVIVTLDTTEEKVYAQNSCGLDYKVCSLHQPLCQLIKQHI